MPALSDGWICLGWQSRSTSGRPSFRASREPASLFGNECCDFTGEVLAGVAVAGEGTQVLMTGERRDGAHIAAGHLECRGDREMAQLLRADGETGLGAEPADDVVDRGAGQTMALAGPVEIDKQRTGFGPTRLEPSSECGPGRLGQAHRLLLR